MVPDPSSDAPRTPTQRFKRLLPAIVILVAIVVAAFGWTHLPGWLSTPDRFHKVDILIVPAGDPDHRVPRALNLTKEKVHAKEIWVVPGSDGPVLTEPDAIERYAEEAGRSKDVRVLGRRARSLLLDARTVAARVLRLEKERHADLTLGVITSRLEIQRTRVIFSRETGEPVATWWDGTRFERRSVSIAGEAVKMLSTLAVLGAGPELHAREVPFGLPVRAVLGGFLVALIVGAFCRPLARRLGLVSIPRLWRAHTTPTPMLGGLALVAGLGGGVIAAGGVRVGALGAAAGASVAVIAIVGLVDDIAGLGAGVRLLWAAGAGSIAWLLGLRVQLFPIGTLDVANAILTILWFMGVTYAVGILDNVDGALAGVGAASSAAIAVAATLSGQFVVAVAAAALAGSCIGFLVHNVQPARLFMGDMGSLGIGFTLAALALALETRSGPPLSMAAPIVALGVPIFDITLVFMHRIRSGRAPTVGGTDHSAHRLIARGFSVRGAAAFLWAAQAVLGVLAVVVARAEPVLGWTVLAVVVAAGSAALVVFSRMEPWTPPWQLEASETVVQAVHRAMRALRQLEEAVGDEAWRLSDPRAAKSTQETLRRLERVRSLLDTGAEAPGTPPGTPYD